MNMKNLLTIITFIALFGSLTLKKIKWGGETRCEYFTYSIQSGDGLWSIADRYGDNVDELIRRNNIQNPSLIFGGQQIEVCRLQVKSCYTFYNCHWNYVKKI